MRLRLAPLVSLKIKFTRSEIHIIIITALKVLILEFIIFFVGFLCKVKNNALFIDELVGLEGNIVACRYWPVELAKVVVIQKMELIRIYIYEIFTHCSLSSL